MNGDQERRSTLRQLRRGQPDEVTVSTDSGYNSHPDGVCPGIAVIVPATTRDANILGWLDAAERTYPDGLLRVAHGSGDLL